MDAILQPFSSLNVWKRGAQRAPHKPLLILLALSDLQHGKPRLTRFADVEQRLKSLVTNYGPPRNSYHPEYPFWRLKNDGIWEVQCDDELIKRKGHSDPKKSELLRTDAIGGFTLPVYNALKDNPSYVTELASNILMAHFPRSLHNSILDDVELSINADYARTPRDASFRAKAIRVYGHSCAICGLNLKIGDSDLGIEAAHIKWKAAGGPDTIQNSLALCIFHHQAFDRGAISLSDDYRILVSEHVHGSACLDSYLLIYSNRRFNDPLKPEYLPELRFTRWHRQEVFREPART